MAKEKTKEEIKKEMDLEEKDEDVETEEGREKLLEDDEISDVEEGYQKGYEEEVEQMAKCANCGKVLIDENIYEEEIGGETYRFCSNSCAEKFRSKKK